VRAHTVRDLLGVLLVFTLTGCARPLTARLNHACGADAPGVVDSEADPGRVYGAGPFQCLGFPTCAAINPSATLVAAARLCSHVDTGDTPSADVELFSIPAGVRQPVAVSPHEQPLDTISQIAWLDDRRLLLLGTGGVSNLFLQRFRLPWSLEAGIENISRYQIIDLAAHARTTGSFPDLDSARCFVPDDDRRHVHVLFMNSALDVGPLVSDLHVTAPSYGVRLLDLATGQQSREAMAFLRNQQFPALLALQPDARRCAVLLESPRSGATKQDLAIMDLRTGQVTDDFPLPGSASPPLTVQWGTDDGHIEVEELDRQPITWTLTLATRFWSQRPGWVLRRDHRLDPSGAPVATVGTHALTLTDGRFIPLLPRDIRETDEFPAQDLTIGASCRGPLAVNDGGDHCVLLLGTVLRVLDLRHGGALSPDPGTAFAPTQVLFRRNGDLLLCTPDVTTIIHAQTQRRVPVLAAPMVGCCAWIDGWRIGIDDHGALRMVSLASGLDRQLNPGTPPTPWLVRVDVDPQVTHALLSLYDRRMWLVPMLPGGGIWEMPCSRVNWLSPMTITWSQDGSLCYLAEDEGDEDATGGPCTGAWNVVQRRLAWRPEDRDGAELHQVHALVPDPSARRVLMQLPIPPEQSARSFPGAFLRRTPLPLELFSASLLDGCSGHWMRDVPDPGTRAGFTPDGSRIVGWRGVVGIAENRFLHAFAAGVDRDRVWMSPSHGWALTTTRHGDWQVIDCAGCGIQRSIRRPPPPFGALNVAGVAWDGSEQHIAVSFWTSSVVFATPLLPEPTGRHASSRDAQRAALTQLEESAAWWPAAIALAGMGTSGTSALGSGPMSAHRLIALELCARTGDHAADLLLAAEGTLPAPLGYLAHDCAYRIHQLRREQQRADAPSSPASGASPAPAAHLP